MRIARDLGEVSILFPEGVDRLDDLPYTIHDAITTALLYLGWEELPQDEQPKKRIWDQPEKLKEHFEWVKRKREAEYGGGKDAIKDKPIEGETEDNDAASLLING